MLVCLRHLSAVTFHAAGRSGLHALFINVIFRIAFCLHDLAEFKHAIIVRLSERTEAIHFRLAGFIGEGRAVQAKTVRPIHGILHESGRNLRYVTRYCTVCHRSKFIALPDLGQAFPRICQVRNRVFGFCGGDVSVFIGELQLRAVGRNDLCKPFAGVMIRRFSALGIRDRGKAVSRIVAKNNGVTVIVRQSRDTVSCIALQHHVVFVGIVDDGEFAISVEALHDRSIGNIVDRGMPISRSF